jgi:hypothetical protein
MLGLSPINDVKTTSDKEMADTGVAKLLQAVAIMLQAL